MAVLGIIHPGNSATSLQAQGPGACVDATDPGARMYRDGYVDMVSDPDTSAARERANPALPYLDSTQVLIVADRAESQAASIAYDNELNISEPTIPFILLQLALSGLSSRNLTQIPTRCSRH